MELQYLGHSGFRLRHKGVEIVIDPYFSEDKMRQSQNEIDPRNLSPHFILITHEHFDHCDASTVKMLSRKHKSKVIGPPPVERKLGTKIIKVRPGNKLEYDKFSLQVEPAFHQQSELPVGYLLDFDGLRVYHAGDTYYNKDLGKINTDVALLPVGGHFTMNIDEALKLVDELGPRIVVPMHFGTFDQIEADPGEMAKKNDKVIVLKPGEVLEVSQ